MEEGHPTPDHVHMMLSIPPKYAVSQAAGRGLHQGEKRHSPSQSLRREERSFVGQHLWARGYFVSTVGRDEEMIRQYIRNQEQEDERLDQLGLWR